MAPILSFIVGSLLAVRALAEPFEKLYSTPEGMFECQLGMDIF
jgi:tripeptidyl-peptidase-1